MRALRSRFADLIALFVLVAAGLLALAAVAANGGRYSLRLDLLCQFAPILAGAGAATALVGLVLPRWSRKPAVVLGLLTLVASGLLIAPELTRRSGPTAPADAPYQLKIIQFNALRTNENIDGIVDWLVAQDPDIVTVEEARHDLRDALVARTGWHVAGAAGDLMIFSRAPRIRMVRPDLGPANPLHWVNATYPSASGPYEVVAVHLDWPLGPSQGRQWADLAGLIRQLQTQRMVLTGDFNATPWSFVMRRGEQGLPLARRDRALATFPAKRNRDEPIDAPFALLPIDHVFAGPGWATVKVERAASGLGSDHFPLIMTLAPAAQR